MLNARLYTTRFSRVIGAHLTLSLRRVVNEGGRRRGRKRKERREERRGRREGKERKREGTPNRACARAMRISRGVVPKKIGKL